MTVWRCGNFYCNTYETDSLSARSYGEYEDDKNKFEFYTIFPITQLKRINEYFSETIVPFLDEIDDRIESNSVERKDDLLLLVGNDLNIRNQIIRLLSSQILLYSAPVTSAALKKSPYKITDRQFWEECSKEQWTEEKIKAMGDELRKLLQAPNLLWFLDSILVSLLTDRSVELLKFLIDLEPKLIIGTVKGFRLLHWYCANEALSEIELILIKAAHFGDLEEIYTLKSFLFNQKNPVVLEKLFDHFPGGPYHLAREWEDISPEVNKQAAEYVCTKVKEELIKYPIYSYFIKEENFPDLSKFNLKPEEMELLKNDLRKHLRDRRKLQATKPFTSKDKGTQIRSRHLGYFLTDKMAGYNTLRESFLMYEIKLELLLESKLEGALVNYPGLSYSWLDESYILGKNDIDKAIKDYPISLASTSKHAMLLIQEKEHFFFIDPNLGSIKFNDLQVFKSFSSDWIEQWVHYKEGDADPDFDPIFQRYSQHMVNITFFLQWPEQSFEKGVCMSMCLDLAEQLLTGLKEGKKIEDLININQLGYKEFSLTNHLQETVESYLDRSLFSKAIKEWRNYASQGNMRTYLAYLVAAGNQWIKNGFPKSAINIFKEAEKIVDQISYLEEMPSDQTPQKTKILEQRRREIAKGTAIARGMKSNPTLPKSKKEKVKPVSQVPEKWTMYAEIVPLSLKTMA